jgi:hypothetical protein
VAARVWIYGLELDNGRPRSAAPTEAKKLTTCAESNILARMLIRIREQNVEGSYERNDLIRGTINL